MKILKLWHGVFTQKNRAKYLLVNINHILTDQYVIDAYFETHEFEHKEDANNFLYYKVAKSELKNWKLYEEQL